MHLIEQAEERERRWQSDWERMFWRCSDLQSMRQLIERALKDRPEHVAFRALATVELLRGRG